MPIIANALVLMIQLHVNYRLEHIIHPCTHTHTHVLISICHYLKYKARHNDGQQLNRSISTSIQEQYLLLNIQSQQTGNCQKQLSFQQNFKASNFKERSFQQSFSFPLTCPIHGLFCSTLLCVLFHDSFCNCYFQCLNLLSVISNWCVQQLFTQLVISVSFIKN